MALLMAMTLRLLVYSALQWRIRQRLKGTGQAYSDQKGSLTQRPTARWVFQSFEGFHVLHAGEQQFILNVEEHHWTVLSILGPEYERLHVSHPRGCGVSATRRTWSIRHFLRVRPVGEGSHLI